MTSGRTSLYAAGFGAASIGVIVMGRAIDDAVFSSFALTFLAVGFVTSGAVRLGKLSRSFAEVALLLILTISTILIFANSAFRYVVLPLQALTSPDLILSTILVWLMVVYSFNLRSDRSVLFMCVPSLSLIGLMCTFDTSQSLVFFIMYLCFACFALVQQNALSHAAPDEQRRVGGNLKLAVGITLQAIVVGAILGWVLQNVLDRAAGPAILGRSVSSVQDSYLESDFMAVAAGPTVLGEKELMKVACKEALLWRSQVYDRYTGRGWMSTPHAGDQPVLTSAARDSHDGHPWFASMPSSFTIPLEPESRNSLSVKRVEQTFRIVGGRMVSLYGAAEPVLASFQGPQMLLNSNGRISLRLPYGKGSAYAVVSQVSTATPRQLRRASTLYPRDVETRYLQVPDSCRRLQASLDELVSPLPTAYDKVVGIQKYLESNYVYDLGAPAAPPDEDAVIYFMLKSRRGYCDVFASAMTIMCRLSEIPCRVAVGYATGKLEPGDGLYHVRQKDRHAWVEVYFPGYGWIPFDPAPPEAGNSLADRIRAAWRGMTATVISWTDSFWMLALLFCLVAYLAKVEVIDRLRARNAAFKPLASIGRAGENYRRMCDAFARLGYPRSAAMTPCEYCRGLESLLRPNCPNLVTGVQAVTNDFIEARYAGRQVPPDRTASTASLLSGLIREASRAAKQKLLPKTGDVSVQ